MYLVLFFYKDENEGVVFLKLRTVDYTLNRSESIRIPGCRSPMICLESEIMKPYIKSIQICQEKITGSILIIQKRYLEIIKASIISESRN